jgi:hypothetical protein
MTKLDLTWTGHDSRSDRSLAWLLAGALGIWFVIVLVAGGRGVFLTPPSEPPLPVLVAILAPLALFAAMYRWSARFRAFALGLDLRTLTALQAWRVIGVMFLALYAFDLLPGLFAWPAGAGDVAVGVGAVFALRAMLRDTPNWRRGVWWLNVAGLLDFVGAVGTGVLTSSTALGFVASDAPRASLGALPLSLVPTFAVPLWIMFHAISLLQLRRLDGAHPSRL